MLNGDKDSKVERDRGHKRGKDKRNAWNINTSKGEIKNREEKTRQESSSDHRVTI